MKLKLIVLSGSLISSLILGCSNPTSRTSEISKSPANDTIYETPPPPSTLSCANSVPLKEWFTDMATKNKPGKINASYKLVLFETSKCYAVYFRETGQAENDHFDGVMKDSGRVDFYRSLSKADYKGMQWKAVLEKIRAQLREYAKGKDIQESPLWQAIKLNITFDDEVILKLK